MPLTLYKQSTLPLIFKDEIYEINRIHNLELSFYDLKGGLAKKI